MVQPTDTVNHGTELFISKVHAPDLTYLPKYNDVRTDERFGTRGFMIPGRQRWLGGEPSDVPLEQEVDHGILLATSSVYKPDLSGEVHTNIVGGRPTERLGMQGSFTPGRRQWRGGEARDVPLEKDIDHGTVLFTSSVYKPDLSREARTNVVGGRPTERLGTRGSFNPERRLWLGGEPRDVPLEKELDHGKVLFYSTKYTPDMSGEGETNIIGGRPDERQGRHGSFEQGTHVPPVQMLTRDAAALWVEAGQKENKFRRFTTSHFLAGVTILAGGSPCY
ncbi:unnamed protein product [Choristocarpus tenellus]